MKEEETLTRCHDWLWFLVFIRQTENVDAVVVVVKHFDKIKNKKIYFVHMQEINLIREWKFYAKLSRIDWRLFDFRFSLVVLKCKSNAIKSRKKNMLFNLHDRKNQTNRMMKCVRNIVCAVFCLFYQWKVTFPRNCSTNSEKLLLTNVKSQPMIVSIENGQRQ